MSDSQKVLAVLEAARDRVARNWGKGMWSWSDDQPCASAAILIEVRDESYSLGIAEAAHVAFLRGAGIRVPGGERATREAVWRFNDAQRTVDPVLGAFIKAIAMVRAELERPKQLPTGSHSYLGNPRRPPRRGGSPSLLDSFGGRPATGSLEGMAICRTNQAGGRG